MTVPGNRDSMAAEIATALIAGAPRLLDVLDWHIALCGTCERGSPKCPEYREILDEYGAGPYGSAVFFPDGG